MITHLVLLRPRGTMTLEERAAIADAVRTALRAIPSVRSVRVGRRIIHGRGYEQHMTVDYAYAALLDFDDVAGLRAYLEHPAHERLAAAFFQAVDDALIYDFDVAEGEAGLERLL